MIKSFRFLCRWAVFGMRWVLWAAAVVVIAIVALRVVFPWLASMEPFSRWGVFEAKEHTTVITNREEIVIRDDDRLDRIARNMQNSVVLVSAGQAAADASANETITGVVVSNDGLVVVPNTADGVSNAPRDSYRVMAFDGTVFSADVFARDAFLDVMFLKISEGNFSPAAFANSDDFGAGRKVVALEGMDARNRNRIVPGTLLAFDPHESITPQVLASSEKHQGVFEASFLSDVSEGAAVLSYGGELMGVLGKKTVGSEEVTYVLGANDIRESLDRTVADPERSGVFFGASYTPISPLVAERYDLAASEGAWLAFPGRPSGIVTLFGSPAQEAGLRYGDIILSANDVPVSAHAPLANILHAFSPEDVVSLRVLRNGEEIVLEAILSGRE